MTFRRSHAVLLVAFFAFFVACTKRGPKDIDNLHPRSEFVDGPGGTTSVNKRDAGAPANHVIATPAIGGRKPRELANASARAIVTSATHVYFGDTEDDAVYRLAKAGSVPTRIARRAPMPGALAIDASADDPALLWIGSPGDAVLRVLLKAPTITGGAPPMTTLREGAIFANLVWSNGDVFVTEVRGAKGALTRYANGSVTPMTTFDGSPRGIAVDATYVFVATTTHLSFTTRLHGTDLSALATGTTFATPQVDDAFVYATMVDPKGSARSLIRVKKPGGGGGDSTVETMATNVRDAPIALRDGEVFWFDAERPALLAMATTKSSASVRTVSEDPILDHVYGLAIDDDGAFIASGYGEGGRILNVLLR